MFRSIVLITLLATCYAQYANRPSTAMSQDSIPAWYQMSKQAASPSYPSFERRDQFERLDRQPAVPQHSNSYPGYPTYNTIRSGSTYTDSQLPGQLPSGMTSGPSQGNRRYPTGTVQDPNSELLAAIKDVVAKFKASLDETGIDQDVRVMGNQLRNTWQQLRTGPVNEQLGRLFEKAVADATDVKTIRN